MFYDTTNEEWRSIVGYEGIYIISNYGHIKICIDRLRGKKAGQSVKQEITNKGYARVALIKEGVIRHFSVHRLVARAFIGEPTAPQVNHKDGNPLNNHVDNLEWCTAMENIQHSIRTGLKPTLAKGEDHARAKLTQAQVDEIRTLYAIGNYTYKKLGMQFNVTDDCIGTIIRGERWK